MDDSAPAPTPVSRERRLAALCGTPREVLARLVAGDPLEVRRLLGQRLREDALLVDGDRATVRAWVRCARAAPRYRGRPDPSSWAADRVREAVAELVEELDRGGPAVGEGVAGIARRLGWSAEAAAGALAALARAPREERRAFWDLVLEARDLDEAAARAGTSPTIVARRARRVLTAMLAAAGA